MPALPPAAPSRAPAPGHETVTARVVAVTYPKPEQRKPESPFRIAKLAPLSGSGSGSRILTALGDLGEVNEGDVVEVYGRRERHEKYGEQFRVLAARVVPTDAANDLTGLRLFLAKLPEVGMVRAAEITARFAPTGIASEVIAILESEPERLAEIRGITLSRARDIATAYRNLRKRRDAMIFLGDLGLTAAQVAHVLEAWGPEAPRRVREDPYALTEIRGFGFKRADEVARRSGIAISDPRRCVAALRYVLGELASDGHTWATAGQLTGSEGDKRDAAVRAARDTGIAPDKLAEAIPTILASRSAVIRGHVTTLPADAIDDGNRLFPRALHEAEREVSAHLARLLTARDSALRPFVANETELSGLHAGQAVTLTSLASSPVAVITGSPGTGKSSLCARIIASALRQGLRPLLCAPTGKAATRLAELCQYPASTLHRALAYSPQEQRFTRDAQHPLDADLVIVDETSMVSIDLAASFLPALATGTRLVFVGDVDQLPSVGPGAFLRDLIQSGVIPTFRLTHIFRQAETSSIPLVARAINEGRIPVLTRDSGDVRFIDIADPDAAAEFIARIVSRDIPRPIAEGGLGLDPRGQIQTLSPQKAGALGVEALNRMLRDAISASGSGASAEVSIGGDAKARVGDRVLHVKNNYALGVMNGEVGLVAAANPDGAQVPNGACITLARKDDPWIKLAVDYVGASSGPGSDSSTHALTGYGRGEVYDLLLAYAVTIHRYQGSQAPVVIVPVHTAHRFMLSRSLLYTAVTRAERVCVLVGERAALAYAIRNTRTATRRTGLAERIRGAVEGTRGLNGGDDTR